MKIESDPIHEISFFFFGIESEKVGVVHEDATQIVTTHLSCHFPWISSSYKELKILFILR